MSEDRPREFWINTIYYPNGNASHDIQTGYAEGSEYLHVIKYSAYDKLLAENAQLRECISLAVGQMREAINGLHRGYVVEAENDLRLIISQIKSKHGEL
jgi:hypothetical protein